MVLSILECNPSDGFPTQETEEGMKLMHINDETGGNDGQYLDYFLFLSFLII